MLIPDDPEGRGQGAFVRYTKTTQYECQVKLRLSELGIQLAVFRPLASPMTETISEISAEQTSAVDASEEVEPPTKKAKVEEDDNG